MAVIAVTGSTGFVGRAAVEKLLSDGHQITSLIRTPRMSDTFSPNQHFKMVDFADPESLNEALLGADAVIHIAASLSMTSTSKELEETNVALTQRMLVASRSASVKRFIYISAASVVMAEFEGMIGVGEQSIYVEKKEMGYSVTKARAESLVLQANSPSLSTLALRPPFIWGPDDSVDREIGPSVNKGKFCWISGGRYPYSTVHVRNLAHAISMAVDSDATGAVFITDQEDVQFRTFFSERFKVGGFKAPKLSIPREMVKPLSFLVAGAWRVFCIPGEPPISPELVRLIGYPFQLDNARAINELGYFPPVSIRQGMSELRSLNRAKS